MVLVKPPEYLVRVGLLEPEPRGAARDGSGREKAKSPSPGLGDLKLCRNWLNKQVTALKWGRKARENAMHFLGSRREFRERAVVCFSFCACIAQVRIMDR